MIFYKKKINKETFADELGTNLAEGKILEIFENFWNLGMIKNLGSMFPGKVRVAYGNRIREL